MPPFRWKWGQIRHPNCFSNDFWPGYITQNRTEWFKPAVNTESRKEKCQRFCSCPAGILEEQLSWRLWCTETSQTARAGVKPNKPEGYQFIRRRVLKQQPGMHGFPWTTQITCPIPAFSRFLWCRYSCYGRFQATSTTSTGLQNSWKLKKFTLVCQ